jgi:antibiotic biosynthesis monooxygenase (ABM) superfamily enzyme
MYGTIARMRLKPGMEEQLRSFSEDVNAVPMPGYLAEYVYRMDQDANEYYLVVIFENKETYVANAESPDQHQRYQRMVAMLEGEPEWHDGEIVDMWPRPQ